MREYGWQDWINNQTNRKLYEQNPRQALRLYNEELNRRAKLAEFYEAKKHMISNDSMGGSSPGSGASLASFIPPTNDSDAVLALETNKLGTMLQENFSDVPRTKVTALGQEVNTIYDLGKNAMVLENPSAGGGPIITSFGSLNACLDFGSGKAPLVYNIDKSQFNFFHEADSVFSIQMKVGFKSGTDASDIDLFATSGANTSNNGIILRRQGSNQRLAVLVVDGSSPRKVQVIPAATLTGGNTYSIQVNVNGSGVGAAMVRIDGVETTGDVSGGSAVDSTNNLSIGGPSSGIASECYISDLYVRKRILTAQELIDYEAASPTVETGDFSPIPQWEMDLQETSTIWADTNKSVPITDGTVVRVIDSNFETEDNLVRDWTSAASGSSPTFESAFQNSQNVITYDGVDDNLVFSQNLFYEAGGIYTFFVVVKNDDADFGSRFLSGGFSDYHVITGEDYSAAFSDPYFASHYTTDVETLESGDTTDVIQVFAFKRDGNSFKMFRTDGTSVEKTGVTEGQTISNIGQANPTDWWMDGYIGYFAKYNGIISDEQIQARILELKTQFGA